MEEDVLAEVPEKLTRILFINYSTVFCMAKLG